MTSDAHSLLDEIELLERSLADAREEHEHGELDDAGLAAIERRDGARLDEARARLATTTPAPVDAALDAEGGAGGSAAAPVATRVKRRRRLAAAVACLVVAVGIAAVAVVDPFSSTPPVKVTRSTTVRALLGLAEEDVGSGVPLRALTDYDAVLRLAPRNPEALVEAGWLRYEFPGLGRHDATEIARGFAELHRAVALAPGDAAGHLYYGIALYQHRHDCAAARSQVLSAQVLPESADEVALGHTILRHPPAAQGAAGAPEPRLSCRR